MNNFKRNQIIFMNLPKLSGSEVNERNIKQPVHKSNGYMVTIWQSGIIMVFSLYTKQLKCKYKFHQNVSLEQIIISDKDQCMIVRTKQNQSGHCDIFKINFKMSTEELFGSIFKQKIHAKYEIKLVKFCALLNNIHINDLIDIDTSLQKQIFGSEYINLVERKQLHELFWSFIDGENIISEKTGGYLEDGEPKLKQR